MSGRLNLKLVGGMDETLASPVNVLHYLPWGTRSLKVLVEGDIQKGLHIAPQVFDPAGGRIAASADGEHGGEIQVSWGGGWEDGFEIGQRPEGKQYVFFNLTHRGEQARPSYPLTLVARTPQGEISRLEVELQCPDVEPARLLKPAWQVGEAAGEQILLLEPPTGDAPRLPRYLSRWWPEAALDYPAHESPPQVRLVCRRNIGKGYSQVQVRLRREAGSPEGTLAFIDGDIQFPLVDLHDIQADLFYAAPGVWALRVWFFWLDKEPAKRSPAGLRRSRTEGRILRGWSTAQEIPDAERVDLLFGRDLALRYVCTDLHWRELWGAYGGSGPARIIIGGHNLGEVIARGARGLLAVSLRQFKAWWEEQGSRSPVGVQSDPSDQVIARLARLYAPRPAGQAGPVAPMMAPGQLDHKHTPDFDGVAFDTDLTSVDVLAVES